MKMNAIIGFTLGAMLTASAFGAVENVAKGSSVYASCSENEQLIAENVVDGIINRKADAAKQSRWACEIKTEFKDGVWQATDETAPIFVELDLGEIRDGLQELVVDWAVPKATDYLIEVSYDGDNWTEVWKNTEPSTKLTELIQLGEATEARFVRLSVYAFKKGKTGNLSIYEIQVFNGKAPKLSENLDLPKKAQF